MSVHRNLLTLWVSFCCLLAATACLAVDISGTVVDEKGKPLAGIRVCAGASTSDAGDTTGTETKTDNDGKFAFTGLPEPKEDGTAVEAYEPGKQTGSAFVPRGSTKPVQIKLLPAGKITIQLLWMNGKSASGIKVAPAVGKYPAYWGLILSTDAEGKVTLPFVSTKGNTQISVADKRCVHSDITLRCPEDNGAKFRVLPGGSIEGKIVDEKGAPVAGVTLSATANENGFWGGYGTAITKSDGTFTLERLDTDLFFVSAKPKDGLAAEIITCDVQRGKITKLPVIKMQTAGKIEGVILDRETGEPIANMGVGFEPTKWSKSWGGDSTTTDKNGHFIIIGIGGFTLGPEIFGDSPYSYESNPDASCTFTLDPGQAEKCEIKLTKLPNPRYTSPWEDAPPPEPAKILKALVIDELSKPVPGCELRLMDKDAVKTLDTLTTDDRGEVSTATPEGEKFVWVASKHGYTDAWNATTCRVSDPVVLRLFKSKPFSGQVVNEQGKAVPNAKITAAELTGYYYNGVQLGYTRLSVKNLVKQAPSAVTDSRGMFSLSGIPTKNAIGVKVSHPQYVSGQTTVFAPTDHAKLVLMSPVTLRGRVKGLDKDISRVPLVAVIIWYEASDGSVSAKVEPDGTFTVRGIPNADAVKSGRVRISIQLTQDKKRPLPEGVEFVKEASYPYDSLIGISKDASGRLYYGFRSLYLEAIPEKTGVVLSVYPLVKITGILKDKDGKAVPNTTMYQMETSGLSTNYRRAAISDENGRFSFFTSPGAIKLVPIRNNMLGDKPTEITAKVGTPDKDVVITVGNTPPNSSEYRSNYITEYVRVIGPDGVAVPRPVLKEVPAGKTLYIPASGLDGMVSLMGEKGTKVKLTSPFMKKPVFITLQKSERVSIVRFDTKQSLVLTEKEWSTTTGAGFG